jgi:hypothetical protein
MVASAFDISLATKAARALGRDGPRAEISSRTQPGKPMSFG